MNNLIRLANLIDRLPPDADNGRTMVDPGVKFLAELIDDEEARVATLCSTHPESVEEIAQNAGVDPESIRKTLEELAYKGVLFSFEENGVMKYHRIPWAPGIVEHYLLTKEQRTEKLARAFDEFCKSINLKGVIMPVGGGNLRVIPIKAGIKAETHIATYEELQTYLDQSDIYSAGDCACRLSLELMGEACEHPIKDMCIQIGPEADYYIRTGRARRISRQEAEEIIQQAEKEGLVHEVFNNEGLNKSSFICNCCGCACASLQKATLFRIPDAVRSNFVAEVNPDNCVGCGTCVESCNANALALGSSFVKGEQAPRYDHPDDTEWTEQHWDFNYRARTMVNAHGTAPCKTACPAHISVQGYIRKAYQGKFQEALKVIKRDNPFPAICGRICPHDCENECTRKNLDEAIAIDDVKKHIADKELVSKNRYIPEIRTKRDGKVAVIGSGPAGLSCAYYAAVDGFDVTVFEKYDMLGGMMTLGIPSFRLEKDVIDAEIDVLRKLGVQFKTGVEIGKDLTFQELRKQGFKAFFLGIGVQGSRKLDIKGENSQGVVAGVDFLRNVNTGKAEKLTGKTVVIGGGNVAVDVARTSVRFGSETTDLYCLESKAEMPALAEEQEEAAQEGVVIHNAWGPKRILMKDGKVTSVEFKRCLSVFDENGKFNPQYDENDTMEVACTNVLVSIGQSIEWGDVLTGTSIKTGSGNTIEADPFTLQTGEPDIFTGGDVLTGPKFAINAIASGKSGAISIKRYLLSQSLTMRREREYHPLDKQNIELAGYDRLPRQRIPEIDYTESHRTFKDLRTDLTDEQIQKETTRCLGCGISVVDAYQCFGCGVCATKCEFDAIHLVRSHDAGTPEDTAAWFKNVASYAALRQGRIAEKQKASPAR
jgi:NADPH-dependent glutamate synthase beta subunit-like oxidoreductase/NAD-dependent dihydropyrimidine dehydrogenase PreA subunit